MSLELEFVQTPALVERRVLDYPMLPDPTRRGLDRSVTITAPLKYAFVFILCLAGLVAAALTGIGSWIVYVAILLFA